jgi:hypothetical protein
LPHRIIGTEKCTHVNKKTNNRDCNKLGRHNPKPMISWNSKDKTGKKRKYFQFIHNDGTRHNIESYDDHWLNQIKGHPYEELLRNLNSFENICYASSRIWGKIADASLRWPLKDGEEQFLHDCLRQGDFEPIIKKYHEYEHEGRLKIYKRSQIVNEEHDRNYRSMEFEDIDELARMALTAEDLDQLDPALQRAVIIRQMQLIKSFMLRLHDEEQIINNYMSRRGLLLIH